ncbi:MAG: hypothetical protein XD85_0565 [Parcubacteria bacterium 34_609]|nr:MAG: hypothetical protein XD85_0565 [Parcubacteria bacterium 34_609]
MPLLKTKKIFLLFTLLFLAVSPVLGEGLVPCDGWDCTSDDLTGMVGDVFDLIAFEDWTMEFFKEDELPR